ncbi:hypothetical protein GCM10007079_32620 [Nocardiopsis terrae]|nr:hypothetical protein GCM10007079_32620 [Nocardiopsis terrae]
MKVLSSGSVPLPSPQAVRVSVSVRAAAVRVRALWVGMVVAGPFGRCPVQGAVDGCRGRGCTGGGRGRFGAVVCCSVCI